jgi:hypothetical protein
VDERNTPYHLQLDRWETLRREKAARHEKEKAMPEQNFQNMARFIVVEYFNKHADVTDSYLLVFNDTYVVWFAKTLQNWKALVSTNVPDGVYYEVTHDGVLEQTYLDVYKKLENVTIPDHKVPAMAAASGQEGRL